MKHDTWDLTSPPLSINHINCGLFVKNGLKIVEFSWNCPENMVAWGCTTRFAEICWDLYYLFWFTGSWLRTLVLANQQIHNDSWMCYQEHKPIGPIGCGWTRLPRWIHIPHRMGQLFVVGGSMDLKSNIHRYFGYLWFVWPCWKKVSKWSLHHYI